LIQFIGGHGSTGFLGFWLGLTPSQGFIFSVGDGVNAKQLESGIVPENDDWNHVVGTFSAGSQKIYVNGMLANEDNVTVSGGLSYSTLSDGFLLGNTEGHNPIRYWVGALDEVSVWDTALGPSDIFDLYEKQNKNFSELSPTWTPKWDNIVGYWKMDGNWQDSSGNGNHGVPIFDSIFDISSKVGFQSGVFDATDYTEVGTGLDVGNSLTIAVWVSPSDLSGRHALYSTRKANDAGGFQLEVGTGSGGNGRVAVSTPGHWEAETADNVLNLNTWQHIVYTRSYAVSGQQKLYINGIPIALTTDNPTSFIDNSSEKLIGAGVSLAHILDGKLDDLAIWNEPLSNSEVNSIYNRQKQKYAGSFDSEVMDLGSSSSSWPDLSWATILPFGKELVGDFNNNGSPDSESSSDYSALDSSLANGLVGYWNFEEDSANSGSFNDFLDKSGAGNHLEASIGSVSFAESAFLGKGVQVDGVSNRIYAADDDSLDVVGVTISIWALSSIANPFNGYLLDKIYLYANRTEGYGLAVRGDTNPSGSSSLIRFEIGTGVNHTINSPAVEIVPGVWNHYVASYSSASGTKIFLNGTEIYSDQLDRGDIVGSTRFLDFGRRGGSTLGYWSGSIDESSIWNRSLSDSEVQQLYRRGANRIKFQVKSCVDSSCNCKSYGAGGSETDCDGDTILNTVDNDDIHKADFIGPGGDGTTYYSELYNRKSSDVTFNCALNTSDSNPGVCVEDEVTFTGGPNPTGPEFLNIDYTQFVNPSPNRYAQYRVYMEADENTACGGEPCLPELSSVSLNPSGGIKYASDYVEVKPSNPINFTRLVRITIDADSCAMFRLARGGIQYYYDSGAWTPVASESDRSPASDLENHAQQFQSQFGVGELEVIGYLKSDPSGNSQCRIDEIDIGYK